MEGQQLPTILINFVANMYSIVYTVTISMYRNALILFKELDSPQLSTAHVHHLNDSGPNG